MPLEAAFLDDCFYGPDAVLIDDVLSVDRERGHVRVSIPTLATLPLVRDQRGDPRVHPPHMSGALMIHATGIIGFVHAYYVLGLRHADGWVGFGTHIHNARFKAMATLGPPLIADCEPLSIRRFVGNIFGRYKFQFRQGETVIYESEQSAVWRRVTLEAAAAP